MAQPLTLLQSYFYLAGTGSRDSARSRQLSDDAAASVERICGLFRLMQELTHVHGSAASVAALPLPRLLASLAEDAEMVFAGTGIRLGPQLISQPILDLPLVNADLKRTRHALLSMLHLAREISWSGSAIACSVAEGPGCIEIKLEPEHPVAGLPEDHFDDEARLHLALAKANMLGQPGCFRLAAKPFALLLQLTIASEGADRCSRPGIQVEGDHLDAEVTPHMEKRAESHSNGLLRA